MASQVAHIVYAGKYLEKYPVDDPDKFLLGVCFPDIRRIDAAIKRSDTHIILKSLDSDLHYLEPFQAGWKFHLFCDLRREDILNRNNFYNLPGTSEMWDLPNKLLEDSIVYDFWPNWEKTIDLFNNPPELELPSFVSRETFEVWCAILAKYFEKKPDSLSMKYFISKMPRLTSLSEDIIKAVEKLKVNEKAVKILKGVKDEILD